MGRQSNDAASTTGGNGGRMQRSQSRMSLSASFEALAVYFPCMNSFDEEEGGKRDDESDSLPSGNASHMYNLTCFGF